MDSFLTPAAAGPSTSVRNASVMNTSMNTSLNASFSNSFNLRTSRYGGGNDTVFLSSGTSLCLEPYGAQLPSMVRVALNKIEDMQNVSCRMDPNGWTWMVAKKKLYIWRHSHTDGKRTTIPCRELTLPPSEIVHHAKLVCVVGAAGSSTPACIAVSPEGSINYWPNIANESQTLSISADVPSGQECDSLSSLWPTGCILTTTSATVMLVKPIGGNRPMLQCISLSLATKGWLGGLHKKINYIFPGGTSLDTKRAKVVVPISKDNPSQPGAKQSTMYLLSGTSVQVWSVTSDLQQCETECKNVDESVKKLFNEHIWDGNADIRGIQVWLLDLLCFSTGKAALLTAALNQSESESVQEIHFGIVTFDPRNFKSRESTQFIPVQYTSPRSESLEDVLYSWKLLGLGSQNVFYMVSDEKILVISATEPLDFITSESLGGPFLGCGHVTEATAVVFVSKVGLLSLRWNQSDAKIPSLDETFSEIRVPDHLSLSMTQHNIQDLFTSEDMVNRYKSAFLNFCGKKIEECEDILRHLFPSDVVSLSPHDPIDQLTIALCERLVDDAPVGDPRWLMPAIGDGLDTPGIRSKMLIKNFLIDKKEGMELFFGFLHSTNILPRLTGVVVKDDVEATASILYNAYEKIAFAITLHYLQSEAKFRKLIDIAIKSIIMHRLQDNARSTQLSFNDLFYKDITNIHQIFTALISIEERNLSEVSAEEAPAIVMQTTEVILRVFSELRKLHTMDKLGPFRKFMLHSLSERPSSFTVTPWYVQPSVLEQLSKQADIIVTTSLNTNDSEVKNSLFGQLEELTDFILDGLKTSLESLKGSERYTEKFSSFEGKRSKFLNNLVRIDSLASIALAEKYLDFEVLVSVCYAKRDMERMEHLFEKYSQLDFATYTFEWYLKQRKPAELIETFSLGKFKNKLHQFLQAHPEVAWHHSVVNENYRESSNILKRLADKEESSVDDKKFMLCMAKLGVLSNQQIQPKDTELFQSINEDLKLIKYQNQLPDDILQEFGLERKTMRTLSTVELIDMFSTNNVEPDLKNFTTALLLCDLLSSNNIRDDKRLNVVARAIRADSWITSPPEYPEDEIEASLVYKLITQAVNKGDQLEELFNLTKLETLPILKDFFENPNSNFLLHACYEHMSSLSPMVEA